MRRLFIAVLVVALALVALASAAYAGEVSYDSATGSPDSSFKFTGFGFTPGAKVFISCKSPDGQEFTPMQDGEPAALVVDDDGHFYLEVVPSRDFPVEQEGTWTIIFKDSSNDEVLTAEIDISA